jgi:glutamate synthase (NADPH/NADH) large chain
VARTSWCTDALERKLYVIRKTASHAIQALELTHGKEFYVPSMSARTIVYKGLLLADQVGTYYKDLQDPTRGARRWPWCTSASPPTRFPTWPLAHPYPHGRAQRRNQHGARATSTGCARARA